MLDYAPFVAGAIIMLASLSGLVFAIGALGTWLQKRLTYLATFSAGVFAVIAYHLTIESFESGIIGLLSIGAGFLLMEITHRMFRSPHHHHELPGDHAHTRIDGRRVLLSDALHNVGDGIFLANAFLHNVYTGISVAIAIFLHELVQEVSEFFVLRQAGYSTRRAITYNALVSSTMMLGIVAATLYADVSFLLPSLIGLAAGGFLSVVMRDLIPNAARSIRTGGRAGVHIAAALLGIVLTLAIQQTLVHESTSEDRPNVSADMMFS